jgi:sortase (surface protein transpeptidase)
VSGRAGVVRASVKVPLVSAMVAAVLVATIYLVVSAPRSDGVVGRWGSAGQAAGATTQTVNPFGVPPPVPHGAPTRLEVPAIGVNTSLETLHLDATGALTPPRDFARAGWYADGTAPGDQGPAVIAGHVDSTKGPAVFYRLREMTAGDQIDVVRGGRDVRFMVVSTAWYPKTKFPTDQVYGPTPDRQLRLITCGGVFDHRLRSYKDNLVVYAVTG